MNLQSLSLASAGAFGSMFAVVVSSAAVTPVPPTDYQGLAVVITAITLAVTGLVGAGLSIATFIVTHRNAKVVAEVQKLGIVTHDLVNSLSDRKDAAQKQAAFAEGKAAGEKAERADPMAPKP